MSHSRLAASASSRWINCPGSVAYIEFLKKENKIPDDTSTQAGERGTAVHSIIEYAIINNIDPSRLGKKLIAKLISGISLEAQDYDGAQMCFDYVKGIEDEYDEIHAERKYDLSFRYDIDVGGTADISLLEWGGLLHISDYKNGRTYVNAENNSQLRIYAVGAYHDFNDEFDFSKVKTTIIQPNCRTPLGPIRSDDFSVKELLRWEEKKLAPAIELIAKNTAQLIPGPTQCAWCEARHLCEANAKQSFQLAQIDFANVAEPKPTLPTPNSLTSKQIGFVLENKERLLQFLNACEKYVFEQCEKEGKFGEYYLEDKFGNRKLKDEKDLRKELRKVRLTYKELMVQHDPSIMTVSQIESYLKQTKKWDKDKIIEFMASITTKPITGKKLVKTLDTAEKDFSHISRKRKTKTLKKRK